MTKKKGIVILSLFMLMAIATACGKTDISTPIPDETQKEQPQSTEKEEEKKEKRVVQPITNGGNLDVGNGY